MNIDSLRGDAVLDGERLEALWAEIDRLRKPASPQAPIARLQVHPSGALAVSMYAPGLPPGDHDLFCEPEATAPYLRGNDGPHG